MTVPNFMSKPIFYQDLHKRSTMCPLPWGLIRQKYSRADRINKAIKNIKNLIRNYISHERITYGDTDPH